MRTLAISATCALLAVSLAGCQSFREAAGLERIQPDEFSISTRAPLVVPPNYNLRPPAPGAAPTNTLEPADAAEVALFGSDTAQSPVTGVHGQLSVAEQDLLAKAGAGNASDLIRERIAADNRNMQMADESFTNQLLFGLAGSSDTADAPLDPAAEKARLEQSKDGVAHQAQPAADTISKTAPDDNSNSNSSSSGWFSGLFDGLF